MEAGYSAGKKHSDVLDVMHLPTLSVSSCTKNTLVMEGILKDGRKVVETSQQTQIVGLWYLKGLCRNLNVAHHEMHGWVSGHEGKD